MEASEAIAKVANELKSDPRCTLMSNTLIANMQELSGKLNQAQREQSGVSRMMRLSQEMSALGQFASQTSENRVNVVRQLLGRAVGYAAEVSKAPMTPRSSEMSSTDVAQNIFQFGQRLRETTNSGLDILNSTLQGVGSSTECPLNNSSGGALFGASVKVLSSFASSGQSFTGTKLAETIAHLFNSFRAVRFSNVIRDSNETALLNSISCLLETTSENYCAARDSRQLWQEAQDQSQVRLSDPQNKNSTIVLADREQAGSQKDTPLEGFYLITQQLPIFNDWLLKVMLSADPQLVEDGNFRNRILDDVNGFFKMVNELKATYNNKVATIQRNTDPEARLNGAIDLIFNLESLMTSNGRGSSSNENFFTVGTQSSHILFLLAGIPVPMKEIAEKGRQFSPEGYFTSQRADNPRLKNPEEILSGLRARLDDIIQKAQLSAVTYYNSWAVVDKQAVVDSAMLGVNFNIRQILLSTDQYLERLRIRLIALIEKERNMQVQNPIDEAIIGSILDTQSKLRKIQGQLDIVRAKSMDFQRSAELKTRESSDSAANLQYVAAKVAFETASRDFLIVLYDEFNVLLSRTGFLSNRLSNYVQYDLHTVLRNSERAGTLLSDPRFEESLKYAVNLASYNEMLETTKSNPATIRQDIANALNINKSNIHMIESLFKDFFSKKIAELRLRSQHSQVGAATMETDSYRRLWADHMNTVPTEGRSGIASIVDKTLGLFGMIWNSSPLGNNSQYHTGGLGPLQLVGNRGTILPSDTEFGSAAEMYSQYCIQALAFNDLRGIWSVCNGAKLTSPFTPPDRNNPAYAAYDQYLNVDFTKRATENFETNRPLNESLRICSLREYYRRNMVLYMTRGAK
jgi:hypothetical protein